jgi:hypothetical protein
MLSGLATDGRLAQNPTVNGVTLNENSTLGIAKKAIVVALPRV